eukprot:m.364829 g.364829  ORF g.364829 m.364829 type:complete len:463 (-) comp28638_c0_seq1:258-1646(-)
MPPASTAPQMVVPQEATTQPQPHTQPLKRAGEMAQRGDGTGRGKSVTNASHILAWEVVRPVLGHVSQHQQEACSRLLNGSTANLPIKSRAENHPGDSLLDKEIRKGMECGTPLSDAAADRAKVAIAYIKGAAIKYGVSRENVRKLLDAFTGLESATTKQSISIERYPVVYNEAGEPVNVYQHLPRKTTGLCPDGTIDRRTTVGKERARRAVSYEVDTGLTTAGEVSDRTTVGAALGLPKKQTKAKFTGLKSDGTPDLRTNLGKQLSKGTQEAQKEVRKDVRKDVRKEVRKGAQPSAAVTTAANLPKQQGSARSTGLKKDGTPDMRTVKGRGLAATMQPKATESDPRLKRELFPGNVSRHSAHPVSERVRTGLRNDGVTPDLRTRQGRSLAANRQMMHHQPVMPVMAPPPQLMQQPARVSGMTLSGNWDMRTTLGRSMAAQGISPGMYHAYAPMSGGFGGFMF